MIIYHIVIPEVWAKFTDETEYEAESLGAEGFIHCSYRNQLEGVLERYYENESKVVILHINPHLLKVNFIAEPSTGGEVYPHIYGKINLNAVVETEERFLR